MDVEAVRHAFEAVRVYQGMPVNGDDAVVNGLVAAGLMAGPSIPRPDGQPQAFAVAPYGLPPELLTVRKPILDKALAMVAAIRMGQHWGGVTPLVSPRKVLAALLDPNRWVARHSSTPRQYSVLWKMGVVRFEDGDGNRRAMQLIDTSDNRQAVRTAIDLLSYGEAMDAKESSVGALAVPDPTGSYRAPIQTIRPARKKARLPDKVIADLIQSAMGWRPSV